MSPASYATYAKIKGKHAVDKSSHYLELALQYFERSEQANNPQIRGKLRKLAQEYPDKALQMLDRAVESASADGQSFSSSRREATRRRSLISGMLIERMRNRLTGDTKFIEPCLLLRDVIWPAKRAN